MYGPEIELGGELEAEFRRLPRHVSNLLARRAFVLWRAAEKEREATRKRKREEVATFFREGKNVGENDICVVCQQTLALGLENSVETRDITVLPCSHVLCSSCVIQLVLRSTMRSTPACPVCRHKLDPDELVTVTLQNDSNLTVQPDVKRQKT
jgi:hypothetical protein